MAYMRGIYYVYEDFDGYINLENKMPIKVFEELVVMKLSRMSEQEIKQAEKRAVKNWQGNIGCDALCEKYGKKTMETDYKNGRKRNY